MVAASNRLAVYPMFSGIFHTSAKILPTINGFFAEGEAGYGVGMVAWATFE
jgi:hypothetical protein